LYPEEKYEVSYGFSSEEKYEVFNLFVKFFCTIKTQFGKLMERLHSNNGKEYANHEFFRKWYYS